jgi:hypothetical protein
MDTIHIICFILYLLVFIYGILCLAYLGKLKKSKDSVPAMFPKNGIVLAVLGGFLILLSIGLCIATFLYSNAANLSSNMDKIRNHRHIQYPYAHY